jgi:hypothetical protein
MEALVSIVSLTVIAAVTVILLYQNASTRDIVASNMQNVVDQINDATYYGYKYDKKQEDDIRVINKNLQTVSNDVNQLAYNMQIAKAVAPTTNVSAGILNLGQKFSLSGVGDKFGNDEWLRLLDGQGQDLYGGIAANKFYAHTGATLKGDSAVDDLTVGSKLRVKGGQSEHNLNKLQTVFSDNDGANYIRGNTEIRGNTNNIGDIKVGRNMTVQNDITNNKTDFGPFIKNTADRGDEFGIGRYAAGEYRIYNANPQGTTKLGSGNDKSFTPMMEIGANSVIMGNGKNRLTLSKAQGTDDYTFRTDLEGANMAFQTGVKQGLVLNNGMVGVGGKAQYAPLDVYGNIAARGTEFSLGADDNNRGRALVKGTANDLIINNNADFSGGITSHSDMGFVADKCIETGKGVLGKEINAGKMCYSKFSDGLDIIGAGKNNSSRKVKAWDNLETGAVQANKLCLGSVCITENDLAKLTKSDGNLCLGDTCLQENDMKNVKNMATRITTNKINLGSRWSLQPEGQNDTMFTIRDNGNVNKRYSMSINKYVDL